MKLPPPTRFVFKGSDFYPVRDGDCRAMVSRDRAGARQCTRRAVVFEKVKGYRSPVGFCKQHSMASMMARRQEQETQYQAHRQRFDAETRRRALQESCFRLVAGLSPFQARVLKCEKLWRSVCRFAEKEKA